MEIKHCIYDLITTYYGDESNSLKFSYAVLFYNTAMMLEINSRIDLENILKKLSIIYDRISSNKKIVSEINSYINISFEEFIQESDINLNNFFLIINNILMYLNVLTDECFYIEFFVMNRDEVTLNKINNLKKLYNTILYPIISYFKHKYNVPKNEIILKIFKEYKSEIINNGYGVVFMLDGIESTNIMKEIKQKNINIEYGVLTPIEIDAQTNILYSDSKLLISIPYRTEDGILIYKNKLTYSDHY